MSTELKPAITGSHSGCLNCGPHPDLFPPDGRIGVGFGYAALTKDGAPIFEEDSRLDWNQLMSGAEAESMAAADPDHDWRIEMQGPLSGRTYQRHSDGHWALIEKNTGFA